MKEGVGNALNVIVSTTRSSSNMKKELKNMIFHTVSTLKKLFLKLIDNNENNNRKITELEQQVANTNAERAEGKCKTKSYIAEPSSAAVRNTYKQKRGRYRRQAERMLNWRQAGRRLICTRRF